MSTTFRLFQWHLWNVSLSNGKLRDFNGCYLTFINLHRRKTKAITDRVQEYFN